MLCCVLPLLLQGAKEGSFRATFEDKPLLSDVIFLRQATPSISRNLLRCQGGPCAAGSTGAGR